jgi:hypothetical protein
MDPNLSQHQTTVNTNHLEKGKLYHAYFREPSELVFPLSEMAKSSPKVKDDVKAKTKCRLYHGNGLEPEDIAANVREKILLAQKQEIEFEDVVMYLEPVFNTEHINKIAGHKVLYKGIVGFLNGRGTHFVKAMK